MENSDTAKLLGLALIVFLWWRSGQFGLGLTPAPGQLVFGTAAIQYGTSGLAPYGTGGRC